MFRHTCESFVVARSVGMGYNQLVRFSTIVGLPKPMHHKSFAAVSRKVHNAAMSAVSKNLEISRQLTRSEVGGNNVSAMYHGTWQKRGHKSNNGIGTVVPLDTGLFGH